MNSHRSSLIVRLSVIVAVLAGLWAVQPVGVAQAATCTTTGINGNYSSPDTWSGCNGGYPTSLDAAVINHPVTMNIQGYFGSLTINLNGWINLSGNIMNVYGNFVNNSAAPFSGTGTVYFGTGATEICSGTTKPDFGNATVQIGTGATTVCSSGLTLGASGKLWVSGYFALGTASALPDVTILTGGTLIFDINQSIGSLVIQSGGALDLDLFGVASVTTLTNNGVISATRTIAAAGAYTFGLAGGPINTANVSLNVNTGHAFTSITIGRHDGNHPNQTGTSASSGVGWGTYWTIAPAGAGMVDVTLPTSVAPDGLTKACRYTGGAGFGWDCAATSNNGSNTVTRSGVTSFSDWAVGHVGPTAITLNTLDAKAAPDTSAVGWLLALLVGVVVSGLGLTRKAVRR